MVSPCQADERRDRAYPRPERPLCTCNFAPSGLYVRCSFLVLQLVDPWPGKILIDSGWAQRHPFSGTRARTYLSLGTENDIPSEFILLYAPRNEVEVGIIMQIIAASVRYMTDRVDLL